MSIHKFISSPFLEFAGFKEIGECATSKSFNFLLMGKSKYRENCCFSEIKMCWSLRFAHLEMLTLIHFYINAWLLSKRGKYRNKFAVAQGFHKLYPSFIKASFHTTSRANSESYRLRGLSSKRKNLQCFSRHELFFMCAIWCDPPDILLKHFRLKEVCIVPAFAFLCITVSTTPLEAFLDLENRF